MLWFGAHIVMRVFYKDGDQDNCLVMENVILISANDDEEAEQKAETIGRSLEGDSEGTFTWKNRPAYWGFVGVRKLVEIRNSKSSNDEVDDASEISYSILDIESVELLRKFMEGEEITLKVVE
ncbi:DUF4288 domain-containing protein [Massilia sp. W12]|uniref:DUF4288 domain-containing protein n=1 Tax=Massilia sp. W12 TaxID=3126507 RepID=UPI0030D21F33